MSILQKILDNVPEFFFPNRTEKEKEVFLCVFLQHKEDFLFLSTSHDNTNPKNYKPLLIPISGLEPIEEHFFKINNFMFEHLDISLDKIYVVPEYVSLVPILDHTYYFAVVDISGEDLQEVKKNRTFGDLINLPLPYVALKAKDNFFFNIIGKLVGISV